MYHFSNTYIIIEGDDYEPGPFRVTIPAGEISVPFNISIIDDNVFEGDESFNLIINSSYPICGVLSDCILTVTIVDNDGELLHYECISLCTLFYT